METQAETYTTKQVIQGLRWSDLPRLISLVGYRTTEPRQLIAASLDDLKAAFPRRAEQVRRAEREYEAEARHAPQGPMTRTQSGLLLEMHSQRRALRLWALVIAAKREGQDIPMPDRFATSGTPQAIREWYTSPFGTARPA